MRPAAASRRGGRGALLPLALCCLLAAPVAVALLWPAQLRAQGPALVADLSNHLIAITTGFAGTEVLLFGAIDEPGDVVVVVEGPGQEVTLHRKSRILGIWVNTASVTFEHAPAFYSIAASRPLRQIAGDAVLRRHQMGLENLELRLRGRLSENLAAEWKEALIRNKQRLGHYSARVDPVVFLGNRLFRVRLRLPANVPTGTYQVQVYLVQEGNVTSAQTTPLVVSKLGLEADIYNLAHQYPAYYGVIAIVVALVAGWLGNLAFRRA